MMSRIKNITAIILILFCVFAVNKNLTLIEGQQDEIRVLQKTLDLGVLESCGIITDGYGWGSCVAIGPDLILTAGHCIDYEEFWIEIGGIKYDIVSEWRSDQYDIGLIRIDGKVPHIQLGHMPKVQDTLYRVSTPADQKLVNFFSKCIVGKLDVDIYMWTAVIVCDGEGIGGASGSAVLDIEGKIVGIHVGHSAYGAISVVEPVNHIREALTRYTQGNDPI